MRNIRRRREGEKGGGKEERNTDVESLLVRNWRRHCINYAFYLFKKKKKRRKASKNGRKKTVKDLFVFIFFFFSIEIFLYLFSSPSFLIFFSFYVTIYSFYHGSFRISSPVAVLLSQSWIPNFYAKRPRILFRSEPRFRYGTDRRRPIRAPFISHIRK